jgi:hypothetical protein
MNMKYRFYFVLLAVIFVGCSNNQGRISHEMTEEEYQDSKPKDKIAIETTFEPTLELTDEIRNSTLEELIRKEKGKLSSYDQARLESWNREREKYIKEKRVEIANELREKGYSEAEIKESLNSPFAYLGFKPLTYSESDILYDYKLKYVPISSNLAKVYYLENMGDFIRHNTEYYNEIVRSVNEENQEQKNQEQKNWDKYM